MISKEEEIPKDRQGNGCRCGVSTDWQALASPPPLTLQLAPCAPTTPPPTPSYCVWNHFPTGLHFIDSLMPEYHLPV